MGGDLNQARALAAERMLNNQNISDALDCIDDGVVWGTHTRQSADREQASVLVVAAVLIGLGWPV